MKEKKMCTGPLKDDGQELFNKVCHFSDLRYCYTRSLEE